MTAELSDDDRGKKVVSGTERIGVITDIRGDRVYVDPDWDHVDDDLADALGWDQSGDSHTIEASAFTAVQNSEARLREDLS